MTQALELVRDVPDEANRCPSPRIATSGACPVCGFPAHDDVLLWDAETFGSLQCDTIEVSQPPD
jgi:hypothetical protein